MDITYNNLILIYNVVQTMDDETNNILCTTRHTENTFQKKLQDTFKRMVNFEQCQYLGNGLTC